MWLIKGMEEPKPVIPEVKPHDVVIANGFIYAGYCACSGVPNYKYSKSHYLVYLLPKRKTFHIKYINSYLIKNEPVKNLCDHLKSLGLLQLETPGQEVK